MKFHSFSASKKSMARHGGRVGSCLVLSVVVACWINLVSSFKVTKCSSRSHVIGKSCRSLQQQLDAHHHHEEIESERRLSDGLIQSLDLNPILRGVVSHAGTRRGRQALLALIGEEEDVDKLPQTSSGVMPSRQRRVLNQAPAHRPRRTRAAETVFPNLAPFAHSVEDTRKEYELVEQAMLALDDSMIDISYPPLYGADSSPWDTETVAETDNDEWLDYAVEEWTLENVLQSEQVVDTLLKIHEWANQSATQLWAPSLAEIGTTIPKSVLEHVHMNLSGAVEIVRWRTYADPTGRKSFTFRLSEARFPSLKELREKESQLLAEIEKELSVIQRKLKGTTEIMDYDGRMIISIPKSNNLLPTQLGMIRGTTESGGLCFVEPHSIVHMGDELVSIRSSLNSFEQQVQQDMVQSVMEKLSAIDRGLQVMARLDTVFAKAAFGYRLNGAIPKVKQEGRIDVGSFVHPALVLREEASPDHGSVVPIDLKVSGDIGTHALIISGPNGGGKTVAMKSFGLVSVLCRLGIPIPLSSDTTTTKATPRVDFFHDILVEVGDQQSVMEGESSLMARLNACAEVIERIMNTSRVNSTTVHSLVLLDELGGGTDPNAGGAIAQAVLEKLLECDTCRIVATTHSPRLKALSFFDDTQQQFQCATVLLEQQDNHNNKYKRPTFQLKYGEIGDSYALGAASRCSPALPDDVLARAASLMMDDESSSQGDYVRAMTESLERQLKAAQEARASADSILQEGRLFRDAMRGLAGAYGRQWGLLEERLVNMYQELQDKDAPPMQVVGETLATLRLVQLKVKSHEEILRERGLKLVPVDYELQQGESVVIVAPGEWEGTTATVVKDGPTQVQVRPTWANGIIDDDYTEQDLTLNLSRQDIAIWDYDSVWDDELLNNEAVLSPPTSVRESRQRLQSLLSSIQTPNDSSSSVEGSNKNKASKSFTSSRQRKAASKKKQTRKKRK